MGTRRCKLIITSAILFTSKNLLKVSVVIEGLRTDGTIPKLVQLDVLDANGREVLGPFGLVNGGARDAATPVPESIVSKATFVRSRARGCQSSIIKIEKK